MYFGRFSYTSTHSLLYYEPILRSRLKLKMGSSFITLSPSGSYDDGSVSYGCYSDKGGSIVMHSHRPGMMYLRTHREGTKFPLTRQISCDSCYVKMYVPGFL